MRLIDADALWEELGILYHQNNGKVTWNDALIEIKTAPTIEPECKTGTWCVTPNGKLVCSNCYKNPTNRIIINGSLIYDMTPIKQRMKFCPNCGSYNGGEEHETD